MADKMDKVEIVAVDDSTSVIRFQEEWINRYWRPAAAVVYLIICLFDFVVMPAWVFVADRKIDYHQVVTIVNQINDPTAKSIAVQKFMESRTWKPLTLDNMGWIHITFGTLLGVTAWTRGKLQETQANNSIITRGQ
jgi:hypothetical protein